MGTLTGNNIIEKSRSLVYNTFVQEGRSREMAAIKVKPIQPTVVSDVGIIRDVIREATTTPSPAAIERNKEALALLRQLQRKQIKQ
jgi:predicted transcriptional regulator